MITTCYLISRILLVFKNIYLHFDERQFIVIETLNCVDTAISCHIISYMNTDSIQLAIHSCTSIRVFMYTVNIYLIHLVNIFHCIYAIIYRFCFAYFILSVIFFCYLMGALQGSIYTITARDLSCVSVSVYIWVYMNIFICICTCTVQLLYGFRHKYI